MKFLKLAESIISEMSMRHTIWITDRGKVIDISRTGSTHHDWANSNRKNFKYNDNELSPFAMTARSGWVKVRNHTFDIRYRRYEAVFKEKWKSN